MKLYYLYEIAIHNKDSKFDGCFYFGKHEIDSTKTDNYYGSGLFIKRYIKKYGLSGLEKTILSYYSNSEELCLAERNLINEKLSELGNKCLNLSEGGHESWKFVNENSTSEQKHLRAVAGGNGNKKRLENETERDDFISKCKLRHSSMEEEYKSTLYDKVSNSLKEYYKSADWQQTKDNRRSANIQSNKETSKRWRAEFYSIFNATPESFRKYGKLKEVLNLFKEIKNLPDEEKQNEINRFMEQIDY